MINLTAKNKGFIIGSMSLVFLVGLLFALISAQKIEKSFNDLKTNQMQRKYLAESLLSIQYSLIKNRIDNLSSLTVTYAEAPMPDGSVITLPVESSQVFEGGADEFYYLCMEAVDVIKQAERSAALTRDLNIQTEVINKSREDLTVHKLDQNSSLYAIYDSGSVNILTPIEFKSFINYTGGTIEIVFSVTDVAFNIVNISAPGENPYGILSVMLDTSNAKLVIQSYKYNRRGK